MTYTRGDFLRVSGGAFASVGLIGLAGCGGADDGEAELRMTWWGEQRRHERTQEALEAFQRNNPGIGITAELSGGGPGYEDKLATQAAGGNAPDLFQMEPNLFAEFAGRGVLLELDQFVDEGLRLAEWPRDTVDLNRIDGSLLGVPLGLNSFMLLYDAAVLEEAGVEAPGQDWTWEDFEAVANDISRAMGGGYFGTEDASGDPYFLEVWVRQRGGELFNKEGRLGFERRDLTEWLEYWASLRSSGAAVPAEIQALSAGDVTDTPLATGDAAMEFDFSNRLAAFSGLIENEVGYNTIPNGSSGSRYGMYIRPALTMCGYSRTDYPEEAAQVMNALVNTPEVAEPLGTERGVPPSPEIREFLEPDLSDEDRRIVEYVEDVAENQEPLTIPRPPGVSEFDEALTRMSQDVAFGRLTPDEGTDRLFQEAERILS